MYVDQEQAMPTIKSFIPTTNWNLNFSIRQSSLLAGVAILYMNIAEAICT